MEKREKRKEEKRAFLIKTAKDVFLKKGLFNVVMDDIAKEAGLTRRTLYHYFKTKEELAYETAIILLSEWNEYHQVVFKSLYGTGLERFKLFLNQLIEYMALRPEVMKYLGEFDFYFSDELRDKPSTDSMKRFDAIILKSDEWLTQLIGMGIKDGSMKEDIDAKLMMVTINNVLWSIGQSIAIRGKKIEKESGIKNIDLVKNQVKLYVMALQKS